MSDSQQQKPSRKLPLPLYVQIAIALVVGTIAGVAINPGSIDLPDEQINVQLSTQVTPDEDEDGNPLKQSWLVRAADEDGSRFEEVTQRFSSRKELNEAFPALKAAEIDNNPPMRVDATIPLSVTDRSVRIIEAGGTITIDYLRRHQGDPDSKDPGAQVSTTF